MCEYLDAFLCLNFLSVLVPVDNHLVNVQCFPNFKNPYNHCYTMRCHFRSGTREVHNKLEKNRRAHLKECFELLKKQVPASQDEKKTSNLSILRSAIRYIQVSWYSLHIHIYSDSHDKSCVIIIVIFVFLCIELLLKYY